MEGNNITDPHTRFLEETLEGFRASLTLLCFLDLANVKRHRSFAPASTSFELPLLY